MPERTIICGEKEICKWLGVDSQGFRSLRKAGMPFAHIAGRLWIHTEEAAEWFRSQCRPQSPKTPPRDRSRRPPSGP